MQETNPPSARDSVDWMLDAGGEMASVIRGIDWAATPPGPIASWPQSLKTTVAMILHSRHPMFLLWGPDLIQIYNDAYMPSFGVGKHPAAMGQRGRECWPEIWHIIGPQIDDVMQRGPVLTTAVRSATRSTPPRRSARAHSMRTKVSAPGLAFCVSVSVSGGRI